MHALLAARRAFHASRRRPQSNDELRGDGVAIETTIDGGLARRRLGPVFLTFVLVSVSAPMTVLVGGVVTTFAVTGDSGAPLAFPILAVSLALFSVGYTAMSRHVLNAGGFYAYLAQGIGRSWGVAGSMVALIAYNAIQIGLVGLFGVVGHAFGEQYLPWSVPWWLCSLAGLTTVAVLGVRKVDLNAKVLAVMVIAEIGTMLLFDGGCLTHPAAGIGLAGLAPHRLFAPGVGGAFALGVACYIGFEQGAVYGEESKEPRRSVARATYATIAITGVVYTLSAWAMTVAVGADAIVATARDPRSHLPFSLISDTFGAPAALVTNALLITSVFAAMLSFHNGVARSVFALARERVLPRRLIRTGMGSGAPVAGSLLQTCAGALTLLIFGVTRRDPLTEMFTWLSYVGAIGVLLLMFGTCVAVIGFFRRVGGQAPEGWWQRAVAPCLAGLTILAIGGVCVGNADAILGPHASPALRWALPGIVFTAAAAGLMWGAFLRAARPSIYAGIGLGRGVALTARLRSSHVADLALAGISPSLSDRPARVAATAESAAGGVPTRRAGTPTVPRDPRRRWSVVARGVAPLSWLRALNTVRKLRPLWKEIERVVPEVGLLPRYHGVAAIRSLLRSSRLAAVRMPVEILDGYTVLAPWMSDSAARIAAQHAQHAGIHGAGQRIEVESAVLAVALHARRHGWPPAPRHVPAAAMGLDGPDESPAATVARLASVGHAMFRSRIVAATLAQLDRGWSEHNVIRATDPEV
jgi:amino acid transporter